MFENDTVVYFEIDPTMLNPFDVLNNFQSEWKADPSCKGFHLWVKQGANASFWNKLARILEQVISSLAIDHVIIKIDCRDPAQDLTDLFQLPFFQTLKTLSIDGQLSSLALDNLFKILISNKALKSFSLEKCVLALHNVIDPFSQLNTCEPLRIENFSITSAKLDSLIAMSLIESLSLHAVKHLDLRYNPINLANPGLQIYQYFCQSINESTLDSLMLSSIGDLEAEILSQSLAAIERPFQLTINVLPDLTPIGIQYFTHAVKANSNIRVILEDEFNWLQSTPEGLALQKASQKNVPSLFQLTARVLSEHATIYSENDFRELPEICLAALPAITTAQYKLRRKIADEKDNAIEEAQEINPELSKAEINQISNAIDIRYKEEMIATLCKLKFSD